MRTPEHFAQFVVEVLRNMDKMCAYEQAPPGMHKSFIWPEMGESSWRDSVLVHLKNRPIARNPKFMEPDAESDWVFLVQRRNS